MFLGQAPAETDTGLPFLGRSATPLVRLRHPYRVLGYTRFAAGGQISQDMLGIDRPDEIARAVRLRICRGHWG
jgi:hypothetical protein